MKLAALAVIVLALGGTARADDPPGATVLVGLGAGFPGVNHGAEWLAEAAVRPVSTSPLRVHAMFAQGQADGEDYGDAEYWNVRAGVELDSCYPSGMFCLVLDGDVGLMHFTGRDFGTGNMDIGDHDRNGLLVGARGGFDTGNEHLRFRLVLDFAKATTGEFLVHDTMGAELDMSTEFALQAEAVVGF